MSVGSKPEITSGRLYCSAMNSNGALPVTIATWPGPMKPSMPMPGESRIALIVGTIVMWLQNSEKLSMPRRSASSTVIAVDGIVVSKPRAKKTTRRSGCAAARSSASSGE